MRGLAESEYVEENPYFSDYPDDLIEVYGLKELQEITYQDRNYSKREIRYLTIYKTDITEEEFIEFYKTKYGTMDNFYEDKDEYRLLYMWENKGYECSLTYTSYNDGELSFINMCSKETVK